MAVNKHFIHYIPTPMSSAVFAVVGRSSVWHTNFQTYFSDTNTGKTPHNTTGQEPIGGWCVIGHFSMGQLFSGQIIDKIIALSKSKQTNDYIRVSDDRFEGKGIAELQWLVKPYWWFDCLTLWGRVTHICVSKLTIIGPDNGLSPGRRQAIIWTNAGILLIGPLGTNFSENLIGIQTFSFKKMSLKMSSAKWRPFCLGLNVLTWHAWYMENLQLQTISCSYTYMRPRETGFYGNGCFGCRGM